MDAAVTGALATARTGVRSEAMTGSAEVGMTPRDAVGGVVGVGGVGGVAGSCALFRAGAGGLVGGVMNTGDLPLSVSSSSSSSCELPTAAKTRFGSSIAAVATVNGVGSTLLIDGSAPATTTGLLITGTSTFTVARSSAAAGSGIGCGSVSTAAVMVGAVADWACLAATNACASCTHSCASSDCTIANRLWQTAQLIFSSSSGKMSKLKVRNVGWVSVTLEGKAGVAPSTTTPLAVPSSTGASI
jgi:hypothetical protein